MVRLKNRIAKMASTRWPKVVLEWDMETNTDAWASEVKMILTQTGCPEDQYLSDQTDLDDLHGKLLKLNRIAWRLDASTKMFQEIHDFNESQIFLKANLSRRKHSLVTKLKAGVFPAGTRVSKGKKGSVNAVEGKVGGREAFSV